MIVKQLFFGENGREKLITGIEKISGAVKSTLGPAGNTAILESENHIGGFTVTKDGVTVAKAINLEDPVENMAVQMVRQAADRTATVAGDGTTTSVVLTEAIIKEAINSIKEDNNTIEVLRNITTISQEMDKQLAKMSKKVSGKKLVDVATVSANNDKVIGSMIAEVYSKVGMVTVENSQTSDTYFEIIDGIKIDRGFSSKYFVNDHKKNECVLDNPYVLITDHEISNLQNLEGILAPIIQNNRSLLIIGQLDAKSLATINLNVAKGNLKACNIIPPQFGYKKEEVLTDLAIALGGHYYSERTGDNLALVELSGLGRAAKVIVGQDSTTVIPLNEENPALDEHLDKLKESRSLSTNPRDIEFIDERIANINGGIGIIYVGANSDIEQKELRDRIDDSVCAVRAAIEDGILPGGGVALINVCRHIKDSEDTDMNTAVEIMMNAVMEPFRQIIRNAGIDPNSIGVNMVGKGDGYGFNVKTKEYGDMISMGIIDPAKVTKNALKNAVSVATTILNSSVIVTNIRDYAGSK